ncbi:cobalt ECF transporter T component CbiQ [Nocardioides zeae]|uniref:Cobalt/nickel transport system permease protein n=1 Tax=Nocardioides zeae TaxID=1457234 RepID=A0AAJ1TZJ8_9ACTN|nr:cobalt ECF transporter T component CbiQ [Nocardioides zeae]MDQ1102960.1 cobalt/nickel transport system permease protein [Nocardioides zeae]
MGAGHGRPGAGPTLHHPGASRVHRAPAHLKVLALLGLMLLVVAIPRDAAWAPEAYGAAAALVVTTVLVARVPLLFVLRRMVVEVPFVVFALLVPFVAHGPRTTLPVLGVEVSAPGLAEAGHLLATGTIGVAAALTLAATTTARDLLAGLARLRVPALLLEIMGFMLRYAEVVTGEWSRMLVALRSRGCEPRSPRHWPALGRALGALFVRSYERGERVHLAMLSRGYVGARPTREVAP